MGRKLFCIDNNKQKKDSCYVLAQILAVLSGGWIISAGIFFSTSFNLLSFAESQLDLYVNTLKNQGTLAPEEAQQLVNGIARNMETYSSAAVHTIQFGWALFIIGIAFAFLAIFVWVYGTFKRKKMDNKEMIENDKKINKKR